MLKKLHLSYTEASLSQSVTRPAIDQAQVSVIFCILHSGSFQLPRVIGIESGGWYKTQTQPLRVASVLAQTALLRVFANLQQKRNFVRIFKFAT